VYGNSLARTPALDRLAAQSIRYTRVFTTAPVCAQSRAAIITGMFQNAIGAQYMRTTEDRMTGISSSRIWSIRIATGHAASRRTSGPIWFPSCRAQRHRRSRKLQRTQEDVGSRR
jgi:hypothetical protein